MMTDRRDRPISPVPMETIEIDEEAAEPLLLRSNNDDEGDTIGTRRGTTNSKAMVGLYMFLFFVAMIGHEVALEAASDSFAHLDALASAVTCFQFSFCVLFPLILSRGEGFERFPKTVHGIIPYVRLSILVFGATGLSTQAVRYVTYPTKVVFKSAKLIPTMVVASMWQGQKYNRVEYLAAALLCTGAAGYSYGSGQANSDDASSSWGILLLLASIICDAIVPNYQKLLLNQGLSVNQLMINVNSVGTVAVLSYMVAAGQAISIVSTCHAHPKLLLYLTCVGVGLSTAVWAYTKLIQATSSVVAVAVSTLRKVATMFLSYLIFPKPLLTIHILSGLLVLAGVVLSSAAKQTKVSHK